MDTYRRALAGSKYETAAGERLVIYQWAVMDMRPVERFAELAEGEVYDLTISPFEANPQLEGELSTTDSDDFDLPMFYDSER